MLICSSPPILLLLLFITMYPQRVEGNMRLCGTRLTQTLLAICRNQLCSSFAVFKRKIRVFAKKIKQTAATYHSTIQVPPFGSPKAPESFSKHTIRWNAAESRPSAAKSDARSPTWRPTAVPTNCTNPVTIFESRVTIEVPFWVPNYLLPSAISRKKC